jgi:hypothetical protein
MQIEKRTIAQKPEIRATEPGEDESKEYYIEGVAAKTGEPTEIAGIFIEEIAPGAFDEVLSDDVRCLLNHDENQVIARTKSGTLELYLDDSGNLNYRAKVSQNRRTALDAYDMIATGDVDQSSFAFRVKEESWQFFDDDDKKDKRTIEKIELLRDVSPVTYPAYQETTVKVAEQQRKEARNQSAANHAPAQYTEIAKRKLKLKLLKK